MAQSFKHKAEIIAILREIGHAFPQYDLTTERQNVYLKYLSNVDIETLCAAAAVCIRTKKFFPSISELLEVIETCAQDGIMPAEEAWIDVTLEIKRAGSYRKPLFDSDITTMAVNSIGWETLCSGSDEWNRKNFIDTYNVFARQVTKKIQLDQARQISAGAPMDRKLLNGNGQGRN